MDRLEEIRQYAEAELSNPDYNGAVPKESARRHARYCLYLLERVLELEGQMERAREQVYSDGRTIKRLYEANKELEAENERLEKERKLMLDHMARNGHLGPGGGW